MSETFTHIIVGAGSAGCLLANRLSARPTNNVLLIEAGDWDRSLWMKLPVGYFKTMVNPNVSHRFATEAHEGTAGRAIDWPRGRVIGGSSSINGLVFIRGQRENFDRWSELGATGWSFDDVLPYFRRLESFAGGPSQLRGSHGELQVSELRNDHPYCDAWTDAGVQYGLPRNEDFNGESTFGVGRYSVTLGKRFRSSSARAFLYPALKRKNLTVITKARVQKVRIEDGRAVGVAFAREAEHMTANATREVILSAGAIQSPQVLQLSGIGPAEILTKYGIPVVVNNPSVGGNLQDHYQMRTIVKLHKKMSLNNDVRNPIKLAQMGLDWLLRGRGPLTSGAGQVGGAARTKHAPNNQPDVQLNIMPLSVDKPGEPLHRYPGFTAAVWQCHPQSRGRVDLKSHDPDVDPVISPNYLSTELDRNTLVEGIKMLREIYRQPAFAELWETEMVPGGHVSSDAEILNSARQMGGTVFHCVGTCRMGSDDAAVVGPDLKVRGLDGLRVVDASVMPEVTSANTNAPTLMIAEKAADMILNDDASKPLRSATHGLQTP
ncbi:MAG: FAD-dependent oxidoreductase [Hyphomicrobiaceae bacterium]